MNDYLMVVLIGVLLVLVSTFINITVAGYLTLEMSKFLMKKIKLIEADLSKIKT